MEDIDFHDSVLVEMTNSNNVILFEIQGAFYQDKKVDVNVHIFDPQKTLIDNIEVDIWRKPSPTGEILTFDITHDMLWGIIEWDEYTPSKHYIVSYKVYGGTVNIEIM